MQGMALVASMAKDNGGVKITINKVAIIYNNGNGFQPPSSGVGGFIGEKHWASPREQGSEKLPHANNETESAQPFLGTIVEARATGQHLLLPGTPPEVVAFEGSVTFPATVQMCLPLTAIRERSSCAGCLKTLTSYCPRLTRHRVCFPC